MDYRTEVGELLDALAEEVRHNASQDTAKRIADWIEIQRNDVPAQGIEFASAIRQHFNIED